MYRHVVFALAAVAFLCVPNHADAQSISRQVTTVNGLSVDRFSWLDSKGRRRTVSLKREGEGNPGHGGYAVQMSYQYQVGDVWKTAIINPQVTPGTPYEGFGYFVSHERFRKFADGDTNSIARKLFNTDDSPLGLSFPVTITYLPSAYSFRKAIQYKLNYPKYGTIAARGGIDGNGEDSPRLSTNPADYRRYQLAVQIIWYFESGRDFPRIRTIVGMENVPGPDRVSFDMRGPYGAMNFDTDASANIMRVTWHDRFRFYSDLNRAKSLTRNSTWDWSADNLASVTARYSSLATSTAEMGLVEPRKLSTTLTRDSFAFARGLTLPQYNNGQGCVGQSQKMPCDYEWPYQSAQYSLPANRNAPTAGRKIAWGTAAFYGMSVNTVYDSPETSQPFVGFPANKQLAYDICVVLAKNYNQDGFGYYSMASRVAAAGGNYNCATPTLK